MAETLTFSDTWAAQLAPYLPPSQNKTSQAVPPTPTRPFITLTFAQSLDSHLALGPGIRTALSGPASKAMTHYLRAHHAAILVGVGTALADDPGLNCRLAGGASPRPVVLDPAARWDVSAGSKVVQLAREGRGKAPWVLVADGVVVADGRRAVLEGVGGRYVPVKAEGGRFAWADVWGVLAAEGVGSVMVEGGGRVINGLLARASRGEEEGVDSVVVTLAPLWLGAGGVAVAPERAVAGAPGPRLGEAVWIPMGEDVVLCGRISRGGSPS